jgi:hypothetical protein
MADHSNASIVTSFPPMKQTHSSQFISKLGQSLIEDRDGREIPSVTGVRWVNNTHFIANSAIISIRFGLQRNTICSNFRSHDFTTESLKWFSGTLTNLPCPRQWKLHFHPQLTRQTIETDLPNLAWHSPKRVPSRKSTMPHLTSTQAVNAASSPLSSSPQTVPSDQEAEGEREGLDIPCPLFQLNSVSTYATQNDCQLSNHEGFDIELPAPASEELFELENFDDWITLSD